MPLYVDGPVTIRQRFRSTQQKGFHPDDPFYSEVILLPNPISGFRARITARAPDQKLAFKAGVFFFGQMLDALSLIVDLRMHLSLIEGQENAHRMSREQTRRVIELPEVENAFRDARLFATNSPSFLRGLGWYRKGNYTEDPFDKFLAFWNSIEIVASKYYRYIPAIDMARARQSKGQIWECFKAVWGPCDSWPIIPGNKDWIDDNNDTRVNIAHGAASVDVAKVGTVLARIEDLRRVAHQFLLDARNRLLHFDRNPPRENVLQQSGENVP